MQRLYEQVTFTLAGHTFSPENPAVVLPSGHSIPFKKASEAKVGFGEKKAAELAGPISAPPGGIGLVIDNPILSFTPNLLLINAMELFDQTARQCYQLEQDIAAIKAGVELKRPEQKDGPRVLQIECSCGCKTPFSVNGEKTIHTSAHLVSPTTPVVLCNGQTVTAQCAQRWSQANKDKDVVICPVNKTKLEDEIGKGFVINIVFMKNLQNFNQSFQELAQKKHGLEMRFCAARDEAKEMEERGRAKAEHHLNRNIGKFLNAVQIGHGGMVESLLADMPLEVIHQAHLIAIGQHDPNDNNRNLILALLNSKQEMLQKTQVSPGGPSLSSIRRG